MTITDPALLLVAHGTRNPRGVEMIAQLASEVSRTVGPTRVAFVDVLGPSPAEVLGDDRRPTVVVPAFLASGYHVHTDVPREIAESGHRAVTVTDALGPDPALARVLARRLRQAGWHRGDAVVLAAAGSSDPRALRDVRCAARMLSSLIRTTVRVGYVATAEPTVPDAVTALRAQGARRVVIASYLLADGLFHARLHDAGADGVTAPLGAAGVAPLGADGVAPLGVDSDIVDLVVRRYRAAVAAPEVRARV